MIKKQLPKKVLQGIQQMEKIQIKEDEYEQSFQNMKKSSGFCQLGESCLKALDNSIIENKKRVIIWNNIRGHIISENVYVTLWQFALKSKLPVKFWGKEDILGFSTHQLKTILWMKN